ncbi:MAG TPA: serine/threonine-protein kinase [Pyrinomonadaceae bacterium]|jgi:serine/threonine protein kinase|nr:serine/threonine-protein kinase [Pyrinomonadaceae bacterium]
MNQSVYAAKQSKQLHTCAEGGRLQDRYRIVRQLGAGGMGAVYEAIDERLQVTVAIKETFAVDQRLRRQFEQEAKLLAHLHHPALPRVSDYFTEDGRAFLVMQFIAGDDLAQIIAQQPGPFPRAQVIAWADQLLDALIYLHTRERQIIHRDIKPHNLKLTACGQIALLDFGLAKAHLGDQTTTQSSHSVFGYTRRYSPLEQIQDQGTSPQSDIYALGATLYHLLTGIKPPDALARAAALANAKTDPLAQQLAPLIGAELSAILEKALALNSVDRFQTAQEFREALRAVGRNEFPLETPSVKSISPSRTPGFDPFDSYSILKPDELAGLTSPRSWTIPTAICAVAVLIVVAFIASSFVLSAVDSDRSFSNSVKATAAGHPGSNSNTRESRSEKPRPIASASPSPAATQDTNRASEKPKRNGRRANAKPVQPPLPSLGPALRLPVQ